MARVEDLTRMGFIPGNGASSTADGNLDLAAHFEHLSEAVLHAAAHADLPTQDTALNTALRLKHKANALLTSAENMDLAARARGARHNP